MILVRDIFQVKFGKMKEVTGLWKEGLEILKRTGHKPVRLLTDVTGEYYTLVMESTFNDLSEFENGHKSVAKSEDWRKWYPRFHDYVVTGRREIFSIVE